MKRQIVKGSTSVILDVFIQDTSVTTGAGLTGLAFGTGSLTAYYHRNTSNTATVINLVTMTCGTFTSSGFVVVDGTNMPGVYQLCIPDAAFVTGATSVSCILKGAANMAPLLIEIELTATDNQDAVRGGMTALPNAAAAANGGLPTIGTTIPNATAGAAGGLFIAGTNAATTITTALTTTFTGNLTGSVASVTGAVGSVTGITASDVGAIKAKTDNLPASPAAVGSAMTLSAAYDFAKGTVAMTESYAADGAAPTPVQALMMIQQFQQEKSIAAATMTVNKLDGTTPAATFTLNSSTAPTLITRAT